MPNTIGLALGGRRKGPRTKKKDRKKPKRVKVAVKIKGTAKQVQKAIQSFAGAQKGVASPNPDFKQDLV